MALFKQPECIHSYIIPQQRYNAKCTIFYWQPEAKKGMRGSFTMIREQGSPVSLHFRRFVAAICATHFNQNLVNYTKWPIVKLAGVKISRPHINFPCRFIISFANEGPLLIYFTYFIVVGQTAAGCLYLRLFRTGNI